MSNDQEVEEYSTSSARGEETPGAHYHVLEPPQQRAWDRKRDSVIDDQRRDSRELYDEMVSSYILPEPHSGSDTTESESSDDGGMWNFVMEGDDARILGVALKRKCMRAWGSLAAYRAHVQKTVDVQKAAADALHARRALDIWKQVRQLPLPADLVPRQDGYGGVVVTKRHTHADRVKEHARPQKTAAAFSADRPTGEVGAAHVPLVNLTRLISVSRIGRETRASSVLSMLSVRATTEVYPLFKAWHAYIHLVITFEEQLGKEGLDGESYAQGYKEMYSGRRWKREVMRVWRPKMLMKRAFGKWIRVMQNDWAYTCMVNCTHFFSFQMVFKMETYNDYITQMKLFNAWRKVAWVETRRNELERDRKDMRASYSLRPWKEHEKSLSPPMRKHKHAHLFHRSQSNTPSPRKKRMQPACWLPPPPPPEDAEEDAEDDFDELEHLAAKEAEWVAANTGPRYSFEYHRRPSKIEMVI